MRQRTAIQRFLAFVLLLTFAVGTAPKTLFHDLVANHRDKPSCEQVHHSTVLHKQSYNCHCEDLVITAPFLLAPVSVVSIPPVAPARVASISRSEPLSTIVLYSEGRGPPAA